MTVDIYRATYRGWHRGDQTEYYADGVSSDEATARRKARRTLRRRRGVGRGDIAEDTVTRFTVDVSGDAYLDEDRIEQDITRSSRREIANAESSSAEQRSDEDDYDMVEVLSLCQGRGYVESTEEL